MVQIPKIVLIVGAVVVAFIGFKLVTQSGLTGASAYVQNDGYAASGGVLILIAGVMLGVVLSNKLNNGKK